MPLQNTVCPTDVIQAGVNDVQGLPYLVFMGELSEKMKDVIEQQIIPELKGNATINRRVITQEKVLFTLVFDRECYEPAFYHRLWDKHRIAVINYRKNVKDKREERIFQIYILLLYLAIL